jgi:hypothetical protein
MKIAIGLALALALALSSAPAMAGDTFQAFGSMSALEQASLTPLSDKELASIEGQDVCVVCLNIAAITQTNTNVSLLNFRNRTRQTNVGVISQEIN